MKRYKRPLNKGMAFYLITLAKKSGSNYPWLHVANDFRGVLLNGRGDYAKLRYWGLIEEKVSADQKASGYWRLTPKGRQFVNGEIAVPSHIILLNNEFLGFDGKEITIERALGQEFKLSELMAA